MAESCSNRTFEMLLDGIKESKDATIGLRQEIAGGFEMIGKRFEKMDSRVRKLENWRSGIVAIGTFIVVVGGILWKVLQ